MDNHGKDCAGCGVCLKQKHRLISYKYPKTTNSRYVELYGKSIESLEPKKDKVKQNFDYDKIRQSIRENNQQGDDSLERLRVLEKYSTTNKRVAVKEHGPEHQAKSAKMPDQTQMVPVGCFFGNTSYGQSFIGTDGPVNPKAIVPTE